MDTPTTVPPESHVNNDDWHSVKDAKKRKQIQDKLAQRARRKRLREAKKKNSQPIQQPEAQFEDTNSPSSTALQLTSSNTAVQTPSFQFTTLSSPSQTPSVNSSTRQIELNIGYELPCTLTVAGALYINGQILGLSCTTLIPARSPHPSPDVPVPLRPTVTQLLTIHYTGIDRFPFPKMRDTAINLASIFDEEEMTKDVLVKPSFTIKPGGVPWDPGAWKMERPFAEKWGFLFR